MTAASFGIATSGGEQRTCAADSLVLAAGWQGATGSMLGGIRLTNIGQTPCSLDRPVAIELVETGGSALAVQQRWNEDDSTVHLGPAETAFVTIQWWNWCGTRPLNPMALQVQLRVDEQPIMVPVLTKDRLPDPMPPRCDDPDWASSVRIGALRKLPQ